MRRRRIYPLAAFIAVFILHATYSIFNSIQISKQWIQVENTTWLSLYLDRQDYFLGFSYSLAGAFTIYALLKFFESWKSGVAGVVGGVTLTGILYFGGCFLLGCCGSPMLAVYLSLFGSSFLGFTKPFTLILTMTSVVIGYFWLEKKTKPLGNCCGENEKCMEVSVMPGKETIEDVQSEIQKGMSLTKCKKCGCMEDTLGNLRSLLSSPRAVNSSDLFKNVQLWLKQMKPVKYSCLGCDYCFPAVAMNIFNQKFPEVADTQLLVCGFEVNEQTWPPVPGEYFVLCEDKSCPVAVSTLANAELAETLASIKPEGLCIIGKTETENIGVDKLIKNTITNPTIRILLLVGQEPKGHHSGRTLLALWENGVNEKMEAIASPGKRPVLRNVTKEEVEKFRKQVQIVDMIGCENVNRIVEKVKELSHNLNTSRCEEYIEAGELAQISTAPVIQAKEPEKVEMDKAGYFIIIPQPEKQLIIVEHYSYSNKLQRTIEGMDARSIYWTIIQKGWITQLSHAAYLGKELAKAELSTKLGFKYIQDGA